jgi:hypothetical protein
MLMQESMFIHPLTIKGKGLFVGIFIHGNHFQIHISYIHTLLALMQFSASMQLVTASIKEGLG